MFRRQVDDATRRHRHSVRPPWLATFTGGTDSGGRSTAATDAPRTPSQYRGDRQPGRPIAWSAVHDLRRRDVQRRDVVGWLLFSLGGLVMTWLVVRSGARLGTASAPFLGSYRMAFGPAGLLAPGVAAAVLVAAARGWFERARWPAVLAAGYGALLAWALALALVDGTGGLTRALLAGDGYLTDVSDVGDDPLGYLARFTDSTAGHSDSTRGHPPGPVLLLWAAQRAGITGPLMLGVVVTAVGALTAPLVLVAVRGVCGIGAARRYLPVVALAPYAVWLAVSIDAVVAALGAAMVAAGVHASAPKRRGWSAAAWAVACGVLLGVAAMFSYAAPWLGLSVVCLYFARRRPFLNVATGLGVLLPVLGAELAGFGWADGLLSARLDYATRIGPHRSYLWWSGISLVALLLATGPALVASLRKLRNTPGWPFLVGAAAAVLFSLLAGFGRGGVEHAWLAFFPWLTVAAVAPERQGGPPPDVPLALVTAGAVTAVVIEAVLLTAW